MLGELAVVIFSKDRPLQLDATLRSLAVNCEDIAAPEIHVLYVASAPSYSSWYRVLSIEHPGVECITPDLLVTREYDLCISNYAFSELTRAVQDRYVRLGVGTPGCGYLTCKFVGGLHGISSWSREDLEDLHAGAFWLPGEPLTHPDNRILVWEGGTASLPANA